jgi:hypothetical protein
MRLVRAARLSRLQEQPLTLDMNDAERRSVGDREKQSLSAAMAAGV